MAGKYGEPWGWGDGWSREPFVFGDSDGKPKYADTQLFTDGGELVIPIRIDHYEPIWDVSEEDMRPTVSQRARIVACVNAMEGIDDPAAFVAAAKAAGVSA